MDIPWIADDESLIQVHHQDTTAWVNPGRMVQSSNRLFPVDGKSEIPKFHRIAATRIEDNDNSNVRAQDMEELSREQLRNLAQKRPHSHPATCKYNA